MSRFDESIKKAVDTRYRALEDLMKSEVDRGTTSRGTLLYQWVSGKEFFDARTTGMFLKGHDALKVLAKITDAFPGGPERRVLPVFGYDSKKNVVVLIVTRS